MKDYELLPYLSTITVMKTTTGSVTVNTHKGPITLVKSCQTYVLADGTADVALFMASSHNLRGLLTSKIVTLVF